MREGVALNFIARRTMQAVFSIVSVIVSPNAAYGFSSSISCKFAADDFRSGT